MMRGYGWFGSEGCSLWGGYGYFGIWHLLIFAGLAIITIAVVMMIFNRRGSQWHRCHGKIEDALCQRRNNRRGIFEAQRSNRKEVGAP